MDAEGVITATLVTHIILILHTSIISHIVTVLHTTLTDIVATVEVMGTCLLMVMVEILEVVIGVGQVFNTSQVQIRTQIVM